MPKLEDGTVIENKRPPDGTEIVATMDGIVYRRWTMTEWHAPCHCGLWVVEWMYTESSLVRKHKTMTGEVYECTIEVKPMELPEGWWDGILSTWYGFKSKSNETD